VSMFQFDNSFARDLPGFFVEAMPDSPSAPKLLYFNDTLARELRLNEGPVDQQFSKADWTAYLSGKIVPPGAVPLALAYAGHQFGTFNPQLGDGRAHLLGEHVTPAGHRFDIQLKGSGRTPFSRGGDGKAALGPVLREYLMAEAMHALHVPTTRALAVVTTGDTVRRDRELPGAVLTRVAASHLRIGSIEFFAAHGGAEAVAQIATYALRRHFPDAARDAANPALTLLDQVISVQCALVARWMSLGFVHGVMNTDNMTLSGETIDYGPCAFIDGYDPAAVFSSIDHAGRYAFGRQPMIMHWNLARLAEALLPAIVAVDDGGQDAASELIGTVPARYRAAMIDQMRAKLGLLTSQDGDGEIIEGLFAAMAGQGMDFTKSFVSLTRYRQTGVLTPAHDPLSDWIMRWDGHAAEDGRSLADQAAAMAAANPHVIPRNHLVEAALSAAVEQDDFGPFDRLLHEVLNPFAPRNDNDPFTQPAPASFGPHITYCGT
jgi:serine/tyrosine/threonine adenylyltransferase